MAARWSRAAELARARSPTRAIDPRAPRACAAPGRGDRKSTRLNSSHRCISYAVFCLKKKTQPKFETIPALSNMTRVAAIGMHRDQSELDSDVGSYILPCTVMSSLSLV